MVSETGLLDLSGGGGGLKLQAAFHLKDQTGGIDFCSIRVLATAVTKTAAAKAAHQRHMRATNGATVLAKYGRPMGDDVQTAAKELAPKGEITRPERARQQHARALIPGRPGPKPDRSLRSTHPRAHRNTGIPTPPVTGTRPEWTWRFW